MGFFLSRGWKGEPSTLPSETSKTVFQCLNGYADRLAPRLGMSRRDFLKSQMGLAAFFLSMNHVFGHFFDVDNVEASERDAAGEKSQSLANQFIFDVQVHYVHDNYPSPDFLLSLREKAKGWNPELRGEKPVLKDIEYDNFIEEVFRLSHTKVALLSNAPADDKNAWFITNAQAMQTRESINALVESRRLLAHALFTPGQPRWMEDLDKAIALRPDAWKGYTLGDPQGNSKYPWRLDDELLVYPAFEKMEAAGIRNICIHKGLLPAGFRQRLSPALINCARVEDLGKAAKDWPELNFIIYHAAIQKALPDAEDAAEFLKTGQISWVTSLAEIPEKFGVENVYGEIGASFATTCLSHPDLCAGMLGTLVRGLGSDHVCWGTDSVWFGSPQWQIEAMRRFEIPEKMRKDFGFEPLGPADGPVKRAIFGENSAKLYDIDPADYRQS